MRIVLDTNTLISATLWSSTVAEKLFTLLTKRYDLIFTSSDIIEEYKKVLQRDFTKTDYEINELIHEYFKIFPKNS